MESYDGVLVDGVWRRGSGVPIEVVDPSTEQPFASVGTASRQDVDDAVASARRVWASGEWSSVPLEDRMAVVRRIGELIADRAPELARVRSRSLGAPYKPTDVHMAGSSRRT